MVLGPKNKDKPINIRIEDVEIAEQSETLKLLGVHIDDRLNFSKHVGEVCKKASGQVGC